MYFIHTFSLKKNLSKQEAKCLWERGSFIKSDKESEDIEIVKFSKKGLRIRLSYRKQEAVKYDKEHKTICAELIVTPYKLLYEGQGYGALLTAEEYEDAMEELDILLDEIEYLYGVNFFDAKISRIDLTRDVMTPSPVYTKEIISIMKALRLPYGYKAFDEKELKDDQNGENAFLYTNHNKETAVKLYDKRQNLLDLNEDIQFLKENGMLRFEVTMKKAYLKEHGYLKKTYAKTLKEVLKEAGVIYNENVIEVLDRGDIFSSDVLERYLDRKYQTKKGKRNKMKQCMKHGNNCKDNQCPVTDEFMGNKSKTDLIMKEYKNMDICPVPAKAECPYIPSIGKMLKDEMNESKYNFAKRHTRGKDVWNYGWKEEYRY